EAAVLEVQGLGLNDKGAPRGAQFMSAVARTSVIAVPAMPAADTARTVIGPDDPAVVRIRIVGIVAAVEEMPAMEVHKAMAAEVTEAATVPASSAMEGVETSTVKSATMETT